MSPNQPIQLHVELPYKAEPRRAPRVAALLAEGYRIVQLQRLTDRDALVTLAPPEPAAVPAS